YGLLNLVVPGDETIDSLLEYRRLKTGNQAKQWQIPTIETSEKILEASLGLIHVLDQLRKALRKREEKDFWRAVAVYQDLSYGCDHNKAPLSTSVLTTATRVHTTSRRVS